VPHAPVSDELENLVDADSGAWVRITTARTEFVESGRRERSKGLARRKRPGGVMSVQQRFHFDLQRTVSAACLDDE
jgi:hypothetical protein